MAKHLIDLDEQLLAAARAELGTSTMKDTVNEALRRAGPGRVDRISTALDVLIELPSNDRDEAWR